MQPTQAIAIINEAKSRNMLSAELPESDEARVAMAEDIVSKAELARPIAKGVAKEAVETILSIANVKQKPAPLKEAFEFVYEHGGVKRTEHLPIPPEIEGDPPHLPIDLTKVDDLALRRLHSEFSACAQRAMWLVTLEEGKESAASRIADQKAYTVMQGLERTDATTGKPKLASIIEAEVAADSEVSKWRGLAADHRNKVRSIKSLRDSYHFACDRISREWSMRTESFMKEGGKIR